MAGLTRALPYIRLYKGRVFVIKLGGAASTDAAVLRRLAEQVNVLREVGIRVVLVHGGGPQSTALAGRSGSRRASSAGGGSRPRRRWRPWS